MRALALLFCAAAAWGYEGKYEDDPRLAAVRAGLPARQAAAEARLKALLGVDPPRVEIRLEDAGRDPSGAWAEARADVLVLRTEYLVLGAHDLDRTLVHELFHCLHRTRLGEERYLGTPPWVREGAALYVAGQGAERARVLAAHLGADVREADPLARLVDGLEGRHTFLDYYEDVAAFEAAEARHGRERTLALVRRLLGTPRVGEAVREALGEDLAAFAEAGAAHARRVLRPLVDGGRARFLELARLLAEGDPARALEAPEAGGAYAAADAYHRALALQRLGRHAEALRHLRERFLAPHRAATTLLERAVRLEVELLQATGSPEHAEAAARAALDLTPFR